MSVRPASSYAPLSVVDLFTDRDRAVEFAHRGKYRDMILN